MAEPVLALISVCLLAVALWALVRAMVTRPKTKSPGRASDRGEV